MGRDEWAATVMASTSGVKRELGRRAARAAGRGRAARDCRGRSGATMYPASGEVVSDLTESAWVAVRLVTQDTHSVQVVANYPDGQAEHYPGPTSARGAMTRPTV
jgi:hypothetical protein